MDVAGVALHEAPNENSGSIGVVEPYHAPLCAAFNRIKRILGNSVKDEEGLRMVMFAVNARMGPEGLCPTLLAFGTLTRPEIHSPYPTRMQRGPPIGNLTEDAKKKYARWRLNFGLRNPTGLKRHTTSQHLGALPIAAPVLVWKTGPKYWTGCHKLINFDSQEAVVLLPRVRRISRSTCVRLWMP